jgi:thymidylate synthase
VIVLEARNVNYALAQGVTHIHNWGVREPSRAGDVLRELSPVTTVYLSPQERVCLHPWRDANPFFHLIESLWMIAGRDDLKTLTRYVSTFGQFSDDGETVPGAYGKRWRDWFHPADGVDGSADQLNEVVRQLRANPRDRRVVIQMWDAFVDPARNRAGSKDVPCNVIALPFETEGRLNLTVFCRSNDMVLGAYGANAVHFSFLLEYLAARVGLEVGRYYQVSNNFHAYVENAGDPQACWPVDWGPVDPYAAGAVEPFPLFKDFDGFEASGRGWRIDDQGDLLRDRFIQEDLSIFFEEGASASATAARWPFLSKIVVPMALAHRHWKQGKGEDRYIGALEILDQMPPANDWRMAAVEWVQRRYGRWQRADADGAAAVAS